MTRPIALPWIAVLAISLTGLTGCATRFSSGSVRQEIVRQRYVDPLSVFELNLGRFTTALIRTALASDDGEVPFAGLSAIELAVFETPEADGAPALDVTRIQVRGWETVLRTFDDSSSVMVLVRAGGTLTRSVEEDTIADLVVVGAGRRKVVYSRLRGTLSVDLPSRLGDLFRSGGPDELQRLLTELADG